MVRALVLYKGNLGLIPSQGTGNFSAMLWLSCHKNPDRRQFHDGVYIFSLQPVSPKVTLVILSVCQAPR